jgi:G3E family GTPase
MSDTRLRLTILGGYLGSGKTTWLRHFLHERQDAFVHVIVNEVAETPVDHLLLQSADRVTVLAGGCACCAGSQDLIRALRAIADDRSRGMVAPGAEIVLETSGLADPARIIAAIQTDPVLVHHMKVARIAVVVDALHALAQLADDPLGRLQIEAADVLIVTKSDAADLRSLTTLLATLAVINPAASQQGASHGVPFALPDYWHTAPMAVASPAPETPLTAVSLDLGPAPDWAALSLWLSALIRARGDQIVRIKGAVPTPAGRLLIQTVRQIVQSPEILPEHVQPAKPSTLVFIGRDITHALIARSHAHFCATR